ncbi:MAG: glycoside hydrolase family 28 protein [Nakamurella sp.]
MAVYNITDYGAVGDAATVNTSAVQQAIDAAHSAGGGTVIVPAGGTFLTGSLELRSHTGLHVEAGAVLQGSPDWSHYTARFRVGALSAGVVSESTDTSAALLTAHQATGIAITGGGIIDGAGTAFAAAGDGQHDDILVLSNERPFLAFLLGCSNITIRDVTLRDSALWTLRLTGCQDVSIHALRIRSDVRMPNSDGIDIDRCRRVRVSDCDIVCGDDAISVKTCDEWPEYGPCEDITVTGCTLSTRSSALVVGVDVSAPIRNVVFSCCIITDSHRGLSVSVGTGADGTIENVLFTDMIVQTQLYSPAWWGGAEPIFVRAAPWHGQVGRIRNIRFRNVLASGEGGVLIYGERAGLVENIQLDGIRLEIGRHTTWPMRRDLRPAANGGPQHVVIPAIRVERASAVTLRDCDIQWCGEELDEYGAAVVAQECPDLAIDAVRGTAARAGLPTIDVDDRQPSRTQRDPLHTKEL